VDFVIVDTPPGFTPEVIAAIDAATSVVIVSMLDALSLKNTKLGLETLGLMGFPSQHVKLVLNRARSRVGITEGEVLTVMGRIPDVMVPSDRDIPVSLNEGTSILISKPQSEAAQAFRALARSFVGDAAFSPVQPKRQSLFSRRGRHVAPETAAQAKRETPIPPARGAGVGEPVQSTPKERRKRKSLFARHVLKRDAPPAPDEAAEQPELAVSSALWPSAAPGVLDVPPEHRFDPSPAAEADPLPLPPVYADDVIDSAHADAESGVLEPDSYVRSNGDGRRRPSDAWEN
jgi:hypothetical protein